MTPLHGRHRIVEKARVVPVALLLAMIVATSIPAGARTVAHTGVSRAEVPRHRGGIRAFSGSTNRAQKSSRWGASSEARGRRGPRSDARARSGRRTDARDDRDRRSGYTSRYRRDDDERYRRRDRGSDHGDRRDRRHEVSRYSARSRSRHHGSTRVYVYPYAYTYAYPYYSPAYAYRSTYYAYPSYYYEDYGYGYALPPSATQRIYPPTNGWSLLDQGRPEEAARAFANESESNPDAAVPQIGYALAAAAAGNYNNAMWAMRRAFENDPEGVQYVQLSQNLQGLIEKLIRDFQHLQHKYTDAAFMTAALAYLIDDLDTAHEALQTARAYGDEWQSTLNLQGLLAQQGIAIGEP